VKDVIIELGISPAGEYILADVDVENTFFLRDEISRNRALFEDDLRISVLLKESSGDLSLFHPQAASLPCDQH